MSNKGKESQNEQWAMNLVMGYGTKQHWLDNTKGELTGSFFCYQVVNDTVFTTLHDSGSTETDYKLVDTGAGVLNAVSMSAGLTLYGNFVKAELQSGVACFYSDGGIINFPTLWESNTGSLESGNSVSY